MKKKRLDLIVHERIPEYSRHQIQQWIKDGAVKFDGVVITKPGAQVKCDARLEFSFVIPQYVSRAGIKLAAALDAFGVEVAGLVVMDAGLSTGGFTDCLLQRGVRKVYGIDVGHSQVHERIANDDRVVVMEHTNLRDVQDLGERVDLVTLDLSFISVLKVMDAVCRVLKPTGQLITLIKPQFEVQRHEIGRGGIIKDEALHKDVVQRVTQGIEELGFACVGAIDSPIKGSSGNKEFVAYFKRLETVR